jgi:Na+/H+-dicarboxylate symporter
MTLNYDTTHAKEMRRLRRWLWALLAWAILATLAAAAFGMMADDWAPGGSLRNWIQLERMGH